ncbi:hypothetical protein KIN20_004947 [Parelaphostrongylus tenuis]|uniref:G-patch domain-containing protein n=1 Tax=Parelaphostrongylus tenuis TaxID=148309 RepID=A0AAD5MHN3_PARTN|nr:hypothetical protein KIN20_004947 [Parelaphostrongylus tenuis]
MKARTSARQPRGPRRRYRSRGRRREDRSRSRRRYSRSRSQSRSRDRCRRRSKSRSRTRSRSRSRSDVHLRLKSRRSRSRSSSRSRSRSRTRSYSHSSRSRSRSRSPKRRLGADQRGRPGVGAAGRYRRGRIDKAKLLAIARKKAQKMQLLGISLGSLDPQAQNQPKSVDDFVSYCQQIQRRQDKEDRREKGESVSSDDDGKSGSRPGSPTSFKHPFGVRTAGQSDGIKINIVNATSISTKTPQERIIDTSQLRLVYPVSSGVTHKENTEKWTPVVKSTPLKTCSDEQKKYVGITSLEAERYRAAANSSTDHLLPPPPAPPVLTGLGGLLPPPPPPPKLTALDTLLPPPPPLPQLLVLPPEEEMIMSEPDKVEMTEPQDLSSVLAKRASAQLKLASDPNDYDAIRMLKEADDQMASWAAAKNLPGKFTGSTGVNVLSADELQPHDPRYNAWVKKDMFKNTRPTLGGVGMRLMQKMGWRPGEGLGPNGMGPTEPLVVDVKNDRKGVKHPVSMVMELCAKRKWGAPIFKHSETGPSNMREFRCSQLSKSPFTLLGVLKGCSEYNDTTRVISHKWFSIWNTSTLNNLTPSENNTTMIPFLQLKENELAGVDISPTEGQINPHLLERRVQSLVEGLSVLNNTKIKVEEESRDYTNKLEDLDSDDILNESEENKENPPSDREVSNQQRILSKSDRYPPIKIWKPRRAHLQLMKNQT